MTINEAMENIAKSISKEQDALAKLLEAETNKIQKFIDEGATIEELEKVNESVNETTAIIEELDKVLKEKLALVAPFLNN